MVNKEKVIEINCQQKKIMIDEDVFVEKWIFPNEVFDCNIYIASNCFLKTRSLLDLENVHGNITFYSDSFSNLDLKWAVVFSGKNDLGVVNVLKGEKIKSDIVIHATGNGLASIKTLGDILKEARDSVFKEEVRILSLNNQDIRCLPQLIVKTNDVVANHNVTVRNFTVDELFYMALKGISLDSSKKLLMDGFLNSILIFKEGNDEYK